MTSAATAQTDSLADPVIELDPARQGGSTQPGEAPQRGDRPASGGSGGGIPSIVRRRLGAFDSRFDAYSWLATGVVVLIAAIVRLVGLSYPKGLVFDEVYYATDAYDMLQRGIEWDEKTNGPAYVVHPPLGKWLIALGEWVYGNNELGWRISAAVAGILSVLILTRLARRMFGSTVLGCATGLLLALDGFHMVMSRTALLDIFLSLFVLAAFAALVLDRDARRTRWLRALEHGTIKRDRVPLRFLSGVPWWRLVAGVLMGCAMGVKWSAVFFLPVFALLVIIWEAGARRTAGVRRPWVEALRGETGWLVLAGVLMALVYLATWAGWFLTDEGYFRHWRADSGASEPPVIGALLNLLHYHQAALNFHTGLEAKHTYQSWPWQWLLLGRPVAFYWSSDGPCGAPTCAAEVLLLGTPLLWWSFLPALAALTWFGIARRDWRALAIWLPAAAALLPWFYFAIADGRTMFSFYALPAVPFLVLAVGYVLGAMMTPTFTSLTQAGLTVEAIIERRRIGTILAGGFVILIAACFAWFYPIYVGEPLPYKQWSARMWLGSRWI